MKIRPSTNNLISSLKRIDWLRVLTKRVWYRLRELLIYVSYYVSGANASVAKFVIFAQGRSGSTLLVDLLNSHPEIFCEKEILSYRNSGTVIFPKLYIKGRCVRSPKSVYGFKVKIYQLTKEQNVTDPKQFLTDLHQQGWKIIYLKRRNILRQVISVFVRRNRPRAHHKSHYGPLELKSIYVNSEELISSIKEREQYLAEEQEVLEFLPHVTVTYEDDLLNAENHQRTLDKIFDYLGVDSVPVGTQYMRITSDRLSDFVQNYEELTQHISGTPYAKFLTD